MKKEFPADSERERGVSGLSAEGPPLRRALARPGLLYGFQRSHMLRKMISRAAPAANVAKLPMIAVT